MVFLENLKTGGFMTRFYDPSLVLANLTRVIDPSPHPWLKPH